MGMNDADRPARETEDAEIEVTREMIRAGAEAFWGCSREDNAEVSAFAIFEAMVGASPMLKHYRVVEAD